MPILLVWSALLLVPWVWAALRIQMWALAGGAVVQWPFDRWVKDLTGHRQATMLDNWWVYALATVLWLTPWVVWLARGFDFGSSPWRSRRVRIATGVVAVNALLGMGFPWWGS